MRRYGLAIPFAALLALALGGCRQELPSTWRDREITIDGKNPDWAGAEAYFSEEQGVKIGLANDDQYLYVYLATWHRQLERQVLMNGLTVWLDAKGGKGKTFGIQYPLMKTMEPGDARFGARRDIGGASGGPPDRRSSEGTAPSASRGAFEGSSPGAADADPKALAGLLAGARSLLTVVSPAEGEPRAVTMPDSSGLGVEAMIDIVNRTLIYELKVPLKRLAESGVAIGAEPGRTIGIGFVVGKRSMPSRGAGESRGPEGSGMPGGDEGGGPPGGGGGFPGGQGGGGMGGMPGGGMGSRGGMPGMSGGATEEPFELWVRAALAAKP